MIAGVIHPEIIETVCLWLGGTRRYHENGAPCWYCRARRKDMGLKLLDLRDDLRRVYHEAARGVVSEDREVRWEELGVLFLSRGA